jgi:hypothetical protein
MSKFFKINGFWKDDLSSFEGFIVKEFDDVEIDETHDEQIFFYGLSETEIKEAIENPEGSSLAFTITSYEETDF